MSIQPNRVIQRIIEQVDQSDWPALEGEVVCSVANGNFLRFYRSPHHERYATPLHFWVHALREELRATEHREDLVGIACHALGHKQSLEDWLSELSALGVDEGWNAIDALGLSAWVDAGPSVEIYRMLDSDCRRSSVVADASSMMSHFWGHGSRASWRRRASCRA